MFNALKSIPQYSHRYVEAQKFKKNRNINKNYPYQIMKSFREAHKQSTHSHCVMTELLTMKCKRMAFSIIQVLIKKAANFHVPKYHAQLSLTTLCVFYICNTHDIERIKICYTKIKKKYFRFQLWKCL